MKPTSMKGNGTESSQVSGAAAPAAVRCETGEDVGRALAADRLAEATRGAAADCGAIDEDCIDFEDALDAADADGGG